jgi:hypothetical protein
MRPSTGELIATDADLPMLSMTNENAVRHFISDGKHAAFLQAVVDLAGRAAGRRLQFRHAKIRLRDRRLATIAAKKAANHASFPTIERGPPMMNFLLCTPNGVFTAGIIVGGLIGFALRQLVPGLRKYNYLREVVVVAAAAAGAVLAGILSLYFPPAC